MNKRAAQSKADTFTGTIGELRAMISASRRDGISIVNPSLEKARALDILARALDGRDANERPVMWKRDPYSSSGKMRGTRDRLIVQNIFRECTPAGRSYPEEPNNG